jgi:tetratricopeptide (TPR) repeat protein
MAETDVIDRTALAARLAAAGDEERAALLARHAALADVELARALKALYDDTKVSEPARANGAAAAITILTDLIDDPEAHAFASWTAGMAALQLEGHLEQALALLDKAIMGFEKLVQPQMAAAAQVSRLHALAMLGRYDEAIECGLRARDVFLAHDDALAAGKIEQNLGNI